MFPECSLSVRLVFHLHALLGNEGLADAVGAVELRLLALVAAAVEEHADLVVPAVALVALHPRLLQLLCKVRRTSERSVVWIVHIVTTEPNHLKRLLIQQWIVHIVTTGLVLWFGCVIWCCGFVVVAVRGCYYHLAFSGLVLWLVLWLLL
jgi:hypothetical protein